MSENNYPAKLQVIIDIEPDMSVRFDNIHNQPMLWQLSFKYKQAFLYNMPSMNKEWKLSNKFAFIEMEDGLYFWSEDK